MAKFYVQSGTLKAIVDSVDASRAALWAVHQAMQQIAPIDETATRNSIDAANSNDYNTLDDEQGNQSFQHHGFIALGDSITLSEVGFDNADAVSIDTFEAFREWHALWHALEKLEQLL